MVIYCSVVLSILAHEYVGPGQMKNLKAILLSQCKTLADSYSSSQWGPWALAHFSWNEICQIHSPVKDKKKKTWFFLSFWTEEIKTGHTNLEIIQNMPCSNQFGKKALSYSIIKNLTVKSYSMPLYR